ncbi:MAG TPA: NAD-dependent epimerase/dehydratase family protein, partial [Agriterribacter sp.]|nr:NAD-dependent epimerase/dehydratase family protein [Agriterribacter sp.]
MKKVLVTGATGFIGSYVVQELLRNRQEIIATSTNETKARQADWFARVTYKPFSFENWNANINYYDFFNNPDVLIHLAWEGLPNYKSPFHTEVNLPRHIAFLNNLISNDLTNITVTGTCLEYGMQEGCLREDMSASPSVPYAIAKDSLRKALEGIQRQHPYLLKWVRLFYMYGKGQHPNSLLSQLERAIIDGEKSFNMSGGEQVRDFLPVEKVAENIVKIAFQKQITGLINCCSGTPITVKQLVEDYLRLNN